MEHFLQSRVRGDEKQESTVGLFVMLVGPEGQPRVGPCGFGETGKTRESLTWLQL